MKAYTFQSMFLHWLMVLALLFAFRGAEGYFQPLSLDINDTIAFTEIASNPSFSPESISAQFVKATGHVGISFLPGFGLHALGLTPEHQYLLLCGVQLSALALGLVLFFSAFGWGTGFIFLGTILAYCSGLTGFGRYLALGAGFKIVTSGFALAIGFSVLGLFLRGHRYASAILAGLLASYHPSHGAILLFMLGSYAAWECLIVRTLSPKDLLKLGAVTLLSLAPFIATVLPNLGSAADFDRAAWWDYIFNKTSNLTPLQDGIFVVLSILAAVAGALISARALARTTPETGNRATGILICIFTLWAVQILATEFFRSITITQLALTRCTPYAALIIATLLAYKTCRAFQTDDRFNKVTGSLLSLAAILVALPNKIPPLDIPTFASALIETRWIYHGKVIQQANIAVLSLSLAWWMWLPRLTANQKSFWTKIFAVFLFLSILFIGLRIPSLAALIALTLYYRPVWLLSLPVRPALFYCAFTIAALFLLTVRNPWNTAEAHKASSLAQMVANHVPEDGMVVTVPAGNKSSEFIIPLRAAWLGEGESQYLFYAPFLVSQVKERMALLGIDAFSDDNTCHDWLVNPMCRRIAFAEKTEKNNAVWRNNIQKIKKQTPSVTHIMMPEDMLCPKDKVVAKAEGQALISVRGLFKQGCGQ